MDPEINLVSDHEESSPISLQEVFVETTSSENENNTVDLSPEFLQRKLYFSLEHLKKMHSELPE